MKGFLVFLLLFLLAQAQAVTQDPELFSKECPIKFLGKVKELSSLGIPVSLPMLEKVRVIFEVQEATRGNLGQSHSIDVLKYGPVQFESEKVYSVEMNGSFLCSAMRVE